MLSCYLGNFLPKVLCKFLNLGIISDSTFNRVTNLYTAPAIEKWWGKMQNVILSLLNHKEVILAGDGRNDSPGHSSTYCQYTFMDTFSDLIVHQELIDVRDAQLKSPNMEKIGFQKGLDFLMNQMNVEGVVTDSHSSISALLGKNPSMFCFCFT